MHLLLPLIATIPVSFVALMPVINPVGTAILLQSLTVGVGDAVRVTVARRIAVNTVIVLSVVLLGGHYLLRFFGISVPIVQLAGGAVLLSMGWKWLREEDSPDRDKATAAPSADTGSLLEKTFYPFTFPITVGPGGIAVALTLSAHTAHATWAETAAIQLGAMIGVVGVATLTALSFLYSNRLTSRLGATGTSVLLRLMAFIVVCIGAQIGWSGAKALIESLPQK